MENTIKCELESTLKQSEGSIGLRSIEWAAGIYEGEGALTTQGKVGTWRLVVNMTDYDILKYFHEIIGVGKLHGPWKPPSVPAHHKPHWSVRVNNKHDIFKVICEFYPYMGERRRAKFDEFLTTYGN